MTQRTRSAYKGVAAGWCVAIPCGEGRRGVGVVARTDVNNLVLLFVFAREPSEMNGAELRPTDAATVVITGKRPVFLWESLGKIDSFNAAIWRIPLFSLVNGRAGRVGETDLSSPVAQYEVSEEVWKLLPPLGICNGAAVERKCSEAWVRKRLISL
jgi:hypothetical protein